MKGTVQKFMQELKEGEQGMKGEEGKLAPDKIMTKVEIPRGDFKEHEVFLSGMGTTPMNAAAGDSVIARLIRAISSLNFKAERSPSKLVALLL